jgi:hypothetical protein
MAIPAVLQRQLLALDAPVREQLGHALLESSDDECFALAQQLLAASDDGLSSEARAELLTAIDDSTADIDAGRTLPYEDAMAQLRAVHARRAAR